MTKEAWYYKKKQNNEVQCFLCPHHCVISEGASGKCNVRKNEKGKLITGAYGKLAAIHRDPIEKKPLYHFYPGHQLLSIGTYGCNFHCSFCQNCDISQAKFEQTYSLKDFSVEEVVNAADAPENMGVAYTYNEPAIFYEFMFDTAEAIRNKGLKNVMVSNGFISREPLEKLLPFMDAFNIDLKAFTNEFYMNYAEGRLNPVLRTCEYIRSYGKHLEITFLVIPGLNDAESTFKEMLQWIRTNLGSDTVLHISRYFPAYKLQVEPTPTRTILRFAELAMDYLEFVYIGNMHSADGNNTYCPSCNHLVINRHRYKTDLSKLDNEGKCVFCGKQIIKYLKN